jgi:PPK2 family polyphosphate:nucleotide phosphotransferase
MKPTDLRQLARRFRVTHGHHFKLQSVATDDTAGLDIKQQADELVAHGVRELTALQERLYAQDKFSLLLIFQAMDAAGKDGTIKHVMSGVNPQGCEVHAFKAPSPEELDHDFLWRCARLLPRRGHIGIFNRSYYEEVLVVRVHPEMLARQQLPDALVTSRIWQERCKDIATWEAYLSRQGVVIRKFFLHVSKEEQRSRFLKRLEEPEKHWKFSLNDVHERKHFSDYMKAYEDMIRMTASRHAPWYVIPADQKWFARLAVSSAIVDALHEIDPEFPEVDGRLKREFRVAKAALLSEQGAHKR